MGKPTKQHTTRAFVVPPRTRALDWLRAHSWPRLVMSMMLMVTVGAAFLSSVQMHHFGVVPLVRYPSAVLVGWITFLLLVGVWVVWQRYRHTPQAPQVRRESDANRVSSAQRNNQNKNSSSDASSGLDIFPNGSGGGSSGGSSGSWSGGGGRFGGGGASDSFAAAPEELGTSSALSIFDSGSSSSSSSGGSFFDIDIDGDLGGFLLLIGAIIVVALAVFAGVFYAVYNAPIFFAELLIDGGVGTWLYKRADVASRPDWVRTAMKRSLWPVVILIALFTGLAWAMDYVAPGAMTLGAAFDTFINNPSL